MKFKKLLKKGNMEKESYLYTQKKHCALKDYNRLIFTDLEITALRVALAKSTLEGDLDARGESETELAKSYKIARYKIIDLCDVIWDIERENKNK